MDKYDKATRSRMMRAVKSKSTRLEDKVAHELWKRGFRFRRNVKDLYGKPDIAIKKYKVVVFIDSCFWHGCKEHCRMPESNKEFWEKKIVQNMERDNVSGIIRKVVGV